MPIKTSVPSTIRKPGTFQEFDVLSGQRGLVPVNRNAALVAARKTGGGTGTNLVPAQVFSEKDAEDLWGQGSELALMARAAFKAGAKYAAKYGGKMPAIWTVGIAEGATKATYTLTHTGPATEDGDVAIRIAGRKIVAGIKKGDTAVQAATKLLDAIKAKYADLPITATQGVNPNDHILTLTAVCGGVNGNDIRAPKVDKTPAGLSIASAAGVAGAGSYDITAALDTLVDKQYHAVAIMNHTATDVSDLKAHIDARGAPGVKQWTFGYLAEVGTLSTATTLATGGNYKEVVVVTAEDFPNLPGEIAAQVAVTVESESDPALSFDGVEIDLYLPPAASVYTDTEIETALAAGAAPLVPNDTLDQAKIVRLVTTKTTEAGAPFENLLDVSNPRSLFYVAGQVDTKWKQQFQRAKKNARTKKRVFSVTLDVLKSAEALEILHKVDEHKGELFVEDDAVVATRLNVAIPLSVVPNLHQLVGKHTLFVE